MPILGPAQSAPGHRFTSFLTFPSPQISSCGGSGLRSAVLDLVQAQLSLPGGGVHWVQLLRPHTRDELPALHTYPTTAGQSRDGKRYSCPKLGRAWGDHPFQAASRGEEGFPREQSGSCLVSLMASLLPRSEVRGSHVACPYTGESASRRGRGGVAGWLPRGHRGPQPLRAWPGEQAHLPEEAAPHLVHSG